MFKLMQLNGNLFAIVKDEEDISKMPIFAHGFIEVYGSFLSYNAILVNEHMSQELEASKQTEPLKKEAIKIIETSIINEIADADY